MQDFLSEFRADLRSLIGTCSVFRLSVTPSGNQFILTHANGDLAKPTSESGLYAIFSTSSVVYFGEASNLLRRQLHDPDNTADSNKKFSNQGRAILKLLIHKRWDNCLSLDPLFMQLFSEGEKIKRRSGKLFEECYNVSEYSKALEGAGSLFIYALHSEMMNRAGIDGFTANEG